MSLKSVFLMSGAIAICTICSSSLPAAAQSTPIPVPPPETSGPASRSSNSPNNLGLDFKLNSQQRRAIQTIGEFAIDQLEAVITSGFDPKKINRADTTKQADTMRQTFSSLMQLDNQQKGALRTILQSAREQMRRQMESK